MHELALGPRALRQVAALTLAALLLFGCGASNETHPTDPTDVTAKVSDAISTVVTVSWKTATASIGYVEYGPTQSLGMNTPLGEKGVNHEQLLLGLKADTGYYYRVVTWDGDAGASDVKSIRTGYLPPGMPELEVVGSGHDDYIVVPLLGGSKAVIILDPQGNIVWYHNDVDSDLEYYRARLALDGKSILYNATHISGDPAQNSEIVRISLDGTERTSMPIPYLAHDFVEHEDGTIGAIVLEDRDMNGQRVRGNKIVELDPEGNLTDVWTSWNCFDPTDDPGDDASTGWELGWTFTNALDYDPELDVYYVGMRNFSSIARVNRAGECEWVLGFTGSTLDFAQGSAQFEHEHQFQVFGDHLLVMDNDGSLTPNVSRVLEYQLDLEANTATEIWSYTSTPPIYTFVLGEPTRYANGDTFIVWSLAGQMERVTADGESIWQLNSKAGTAFGFNTLAKTLYPENAKNP